MSLLTYFQETRVELRQVSWPSRRQALVYTAIVVGLSLGVAIFLGLFDVLFQSLLRLVWQ